MKKILGKIKGILPSKRRLIQLYAALLFNANLKGFKNGRIYQGKAKYVCTPGLNCYSCPGASGSCPLGSLQNALSESGKSAPYYVFGIILLYGIIFGRFICGFLCPFGLIQDLLHKIPTPKLKKNRFTKALSYLKYVILVFFVIVLPLVYMLRDFPLPAFCKYICPAGTLGGAVSLLANPKNAGMFGMLGPLFTWKFALLCSFIVACVFIYRCFCRFFCPLGALYGLFNRFAILGIKLDRPSCTECGRCVKKCKMDISRVGDHECINCGECISECPTGAIQWRGGKIILPRDEITPESTPEEKAVYEKKRKRKSLIIKITAGVIMVAILAGSLVYYNLIDKVPEVAPPVVEEGKLDVNSELPMGTVPSLNEGGVVYDPHAIEGVAVLAFIDPAAEGADAYYETIKSVAESETVKTVILVFENASKQDAVGFLIAGSMLWHDDLKYAIDENGEYYEKFDKEKAPLSTYVISLSKSITSKLDGGATDVEIIEAMKLAGTSAKPGNGVGNLCYGYDLEYVSGFGEGTLNITDLRGGVVVLNFWGEWCGPCKAELPHFDRLATEYADRGVTVVTVHTGFNRGSLQKAPDYISKNFEGSLMKFVRDVPASDTSDEYFNLLELGAQYPATLVIDSMGVITNKTLGAMTEEQLRSAIEAALAN